jgi:hypothetical protein
MPLLTRRGAPGEERSRQDALAGRVHPLSVQPDPKVRMRTERLASSHQSLSPSPPVSSACACSEAILLFKDTL